MPDPLEPSRLFEIQADEPEPQPEPQVSRGPSALGGAAQFRAASELLERGHRVAVPIVDDDGVDLVVDYHWRVQVKSANRVLKGTVSSFAFQLHHSGGARRRAGDERVRGRRHPMFAADFFVCYARPIGAWWIVPRDWLLQAGFTERNSAFSLTADPQNRTQYAWLSVEARDAWHLFRELEEG